MKNIGIQISIHLFYREFRWAIYPFMWHLYFCMDEEHIATDLGPLHYSVDWTNQGELVGIIFHYFGKNG